MKEVTAESMELYRVMLWGKGKGTVKTVRALRKGKTVFVPLSMVGRYTRKTLLSTPKAALRRAIKESESELDGGWIEKQRGEIKEMKALLRSM